jgi:hypothetical protein
MVLDIIEDMFIMSLILQYFFKKSRNIIPDILCAYIADGYLINNLKYI